MKPDCSLGHIKLHLESEKKTLPFEHPHPSHLSLYEVLQVMHELEGGEGSGGGSFEGDGDLEGGNYRGSSAIFKL